MKRSRKKELHRVQDIDSAKIRIPICGIPSVLASSSRSHGLDIPVEQDGSMWLHINWPCRHPSRGQSRATKVYQPTTKERSRHNCRNGDNRPQLPTIDQLFDSVVICAPIVEMQSCNSDC